MRLTPPPPIAIEDTNEKEYEVEAILDMKIVQRRRQYLVKWLGYLLYKAIWELPKNLTYAQEILQEFDLMRTSNS